MIKIEFKEAKRYNHSELLHSDRLIDFFNKSTPKVVLQLWKENTKFIKSITFGCVSELVPSREEVLQQLRISKEQDEEMQQKYK